MKIRAEDFTNLMAVVLALAAFGQWHASNLLEAVRQSTDPAEALWRWWLKIQLGVTTVFEGLMVLSFVVLLWMWTSPGSWMAKTLGLDWALRVTWIVTAFAGFYVVTWVVKLLRG